MAKRIDNSEPMKAIASEQAFTIVWDQEQGPQAAYPADLIRLLLLRLSDDRRITEGWSLADCRLGARCLEAAMKPVDGMIELEDADYDWLRQMVQNQAPKLLGINAVLLDNLLSSADSSRAERRRRARR